MFQNMAMVKPFYGTRYNQNIIQDLDDVTTPPYDIISSREQQQYYKRNPYNIIRLELGMEQSDDSDKNNKYTRAADCLKSWVQESVLQKEDRESYYIYQQKFMVNDVSYKRNGIIGVVRLQEFSEGVILPHENTLSKAKEDRYCLMEACNANFSPIFSLYRDNDGIIPEYIHTIINQQKIDIQFTSSDHCTEFMWVVKEDATKKKILDAFTDKQLFIADGHHRYETALNFMKEMKRKNPNHTGDEPYNFIMMMLVEMNDPGLVVLPTHRIIRNTNRFDFKHMQQFLNEDFQITVLDEEKKDAVELERILKANGKHSFMLFNRTIKRFYLLKLRDYKTIDKVLADHSPSYRYLDVTILQTLILDRVLGINAYSLANQDYITYTRSIKEGIDLVLHGEHQIALFLNATDVEEIKNVSLSGEKMPQKSTYFYPKLHTGLVIHIF